MLLSFSIDKNLSQIKKVGIPVIRNYSFNLSQVWNFYQDERGCIIISTTLGLFEFDGKSMVKLGTPTDINKDNSGWFYFFRSGDGTYYYSEGNDIGYFKLTGNKLQPVSLKDKLPSNQRNFDFVYFIHEKGSEIIFQAADKTMIYSNESFRIIEPQSNKFHLGFMIGDDYYIRETGKGLMKLVNSKFEVIPEGEKFADIKIYGIFPFSGNTLMICTREAGLFVYDLNSKTNRLKKFVTEVDQWLETSMVNHPISLQNGEYYAIGSLLKGLVIIDKNGKLIQQLSKDNGLNSNTIYSLYEDREKQLWIGYNNGLACAEINSPYSTTNTKIDLNILFYTTAYFNNRIYFGGEPYMLYFDWDANINPVNPQKFTEIHQSSGISWRCKEFDNTLCFGHYTGGCIIDKYNVYHTTTIPFNVWMLFPLYHNPEKYIVHTAKELYIAQKTKNNWKYQALPLGNITASKLTLDNLHNVWIESIQKELYRIRVDSLTDRITEIKRFSLEQGLPDSLNVSLVNYKDKILANTSQNVFCFDENSDKFYRFTQITNQIPKGKNIEIIKAESDNFIPYLDRKTLTTGFLQIDKSGTLVFYDKVFSKYNHMSLDNSSIIDTRNIVIPNEQNLLFFDPGITGNCNLQFVANIRKVILQITDSVLFNGFYFENKNILSNKQKASQIPVISYSENSILFNYSASFFEDYEKNLFSVKLDGFEKSWSEWSANSEKGYTNLHEGDYVFRVKAKNIYGTESTEAVFQFTVLPPWYRTFYAYISYTLILGLLTFIVSYLYSRRLKLINTRLENLVRERTYEIQEKQEALLLSEIEKNEVESQKLLLEKEKLIFESQKLSEELSYKNKEITNFAMHIITKNDMLNSYKGKLKDLKNFEKEELLKRIKLLINEINQTLNRDRELIKFQQYINKINSDFFNRLREINPKLTNNELRLAALVKLNLSIKEIASLANKSTNAVEMARYRLRSKLGLESNENLSDFLNRIC